MRYNGCDIKWVWLDLDDTLVDFTLNSHKALDRLYAEEGLGQWFADADTWRSCYEGHNHSLWEQLSRGEITSDFLRMERFRRPLTDAGVDNDTAVGLSKRFDPLYLDFLAQEKATVCGTFDLLEHLHAACVNVGVLSNGFADIQHRKMHNTGIAPFIDLTVLSDDIGIAKPDIRLYKHAMERTGCTDATAHLMIGDNPDTDIAGALRAGWHGILLQPQHGEKRKTPPEGAESADTLADVLSLLSI